MIIIDGARGEGGGQIVRSALTLSLLTGKPFRIKNVREGRKVQGLLRQHLTAVDACAAISNARVQGATINSREFSFEPKAIKGGEYKFAIGSAGSTTLILQTLLLPLLSASTPSLVVIEGGTHNPCAPPFDFIERAFLPILRRIGASVSILLERPGFYPAGGGRIKVEINPSKPTGKVNLTARGGLVKQECRAIVAGLSGDIAKRELMTFKEQLNWSDDDLKIEQLPHSFGPGNVVLAEIQFEHVSQVFSSFGERGVSAEQVASNVAQQIKTFLSHEVAVEQHLADQLLLPCVWSGGGSFTTLSPSSHFQTNLALLGEFVELNCQVENQGTGVAIKISTV